MLARPAEMTNQDDAMNSRKVTISNKLGLHARAAAKFVNLASTFEADVTIRLNGAHVNGKSIMGIMMLAAGKGTELELETNGPDEQQAIASLVNLIEDRFGEDD
jgi:phosphocarrier protein